MGPPPDDEICYKNKNSPPPSEEDECESYLTQLSYLDSYSESTRNDTISITEYKNLPNEEPNQYFNSGNFVSQPSLEIFNDGVTQETISEDDASYTTISGDDCTDEDVSEIESYQEPVSSFDEPECFRPENLVEIVIVDRTPEEYQLAVKKMEREERRKAKKWQNYYNAIRFDLRNSEDEGNNFQC